MKQFIPKLFLLFNAFLFPICNSQAQVTPTSQMEKLTRGVVALPSTSGTGNFISWRFFGTDGDNTTFDVLRDNIVIASDISTTTSYTDTGGSTTSQYRVITKVADVAIDTTNAITPWANLYKSIKIDKPADGTVNSTAYSYTPNDCSVADVDGDGEYELILKYCCPIKLLIKR